MKLTAKESTANAEIGAQLPHALNGQREMRKLLLDQTCSCWGTACEGPAAWGVANGVTAGAAEVTMRPLLCADWTMIANCAAASVAASCASKRRFQDINNGWLLTSFLLEQLYVTYLSLPPTLQDAYGPDHDVARHKKSNGSKQEKLHVMLILGYSAIF